VKRGRKVMGP